jgi:hypothetical protein
VPQASLELQAPQDTLAPTLLPRPTPRRCPAPATLDPLAPQDPWDHQDLLAILVSPAPMPVLVKLDLLELQDLQEMLERLAKLVTPVPQVSPARTPPLARDPQAPRANPAKWDLQDPLVSQASPALEAVPDPLDLQDLQDPRAKTANLVPPALLACLDLLATMLSTAHALLVASKVQANNISQKWKTELEQGSKVHRLFLTAELPLICVKFTMLT